MSDLDTVVDSILKDTDDINVVLTPMVWHPSKNGKAWSFTASVSKHGEWHAIKIEDHDYEPPGDARSMVQVALTSREPIVVHDCDDELYAAKLCERLWPGERITKVRQSIERERQAAA
jgi:hypothetical protein